MKYATYILAILVSFSIFSCNSDDCDPNYYCETSQPYIGYLNLSVTINDENPSVVVEIYQGDVEDSILLILDTLTSRSASYELWPDQTFSALTRYKSGTKTIIAIDGGRIKTKTNDNCGTTCYEVVDANINLTL